jgi:hypothetical protein
MPNTYIFTSNGTGMDFQSDTQRALYVQDLKENVGKKYKIERVLKTVSDEMRGYYFGAVLPVVKTTCDEWNNLSSEEVHEIIKKMLFYFEAYNPMTKRVERFGRSVMKKDDFNNTQKAMEFIDIIGDYLAQCGLSLPDINEWKRIRDSAETR